MVVLESVGVIEVDQEDLGEEVLNDLTIAFHREQSFLGFAFDLHQMDLVLIVENRCPAVPDLHLLYVVFTLDLVHFLAPRKQHFVLEPTVKLYGVAQSGCQVVGSQRYLGRLEG